jgi:hypothetical protein
MLADSVLGCLQIALDPEAIRVTPEPYFPEVLELARQHINQSARKLEYGGGTCTESATANGQQDRQRQHRLSIEFLIRLMVRAGLPVSISGARSVRGRRVVHHSAATA